MEEEESRGARMVNMVLKGSNKRKYNRMSKATNIIDAPVVISFPDNANHDFENSTNHEVLSINAENQVQNIVCVESCLNNDADNDQTGPVKIIEIERMEEQVVEVHLDNVNLSDFNGGIQCEVYNIIQDQIDENQSDILNNEAIDLQLDIFYQPDSNNDIQLQHDNTEENIVNNIIQDQIDENQLDILNNEAMQLDISDQPDSNDDIQLQHENTEENQHDNTEENQPDSNNGILLQHDNTEENQPDSNNEIQLQDDNTEENIVNKPKRKKRHQVTPDSWEIRNNRASRTSGKEYHGKRKTENGKYIYNIRKEARKMKVRCNCKRKEKSLLQCAKFTENDRKLNFDQFWKMDWPEKKLFVKFLTQRNNPVRARDRVSESESRRKNSCKYFLKLKGDKTARVCKTMFLNTLAIGEWTALNWQKENDQRDNSDNETDGEQHNINIEEECAPSKGSKELRKSKEAECLNEFFTSLNKVESHYCRKRTSKIYLDPIWKSKKELYRFYKNEWCCEKNIEALSECKFSNIFNDHNLSLYQPKKDACDLCESFKMGNLIKEKYEAHCQRKEKARAEKDIDKADETSITFTMDLQSLLQSPRSNVSALYYKMKLSIHNFTVFNLNTKEGFCYLWNETEGGLTSNEFATILSHFILEQLPLPANKNKIIIYSDGCGYQNRSSHIANALLHISSTKNVIIEQKYLEVGHTQMEADSMHSCIEKNLKNTKIRVPADYIRVCQEARKSPPTYKVQYLDHSFFKKFDNYLFFKSIRPGSSVGSAQVVDLRALQYRPDATIWYKIDFAHDWLELPQRRMKKTSPMTLDTLPNLYNERLKIKKRKYDDLQSLKRIIEPDYHAFYDNIPFN